MIVRTGEYNGNKTLSILKNEDDEYALFMGGSRKVTPLVLQLAQDPEPILQFLELHGKEKGIEAAKAFRAKFGVSHPIASTPKKAKKPKAVSA